MFRKTVAAAIVTVATASSGLALSLVDTGDENFGSLPDNFGVGTIDFSHPIWQQLVGGGPVASIQDLIDRSDGVIADRFSPLDDIANDPNPDQDFRSAKVDYEARITLTYLGSEAGHGNSMFEVINFGLADSVTIPIFANYDIPGLGFGPSVVGDTFTFDHSIVGDGIVEVFYCTDTNSSGTLDGDGDGCIGTKGDTVGANGNNLEIAVSKVFDYNGDNTVLLFFGDGVANNDSDLDDMVIALSVTAVPLPAGIVLLGSVLAGAGVMSRRRRKS